MLIHLKSLKNYATNSRELVKRGVRFFIFLVIVHTASLQLVNAQDSLQIEIQQGEFWWGGLSVDGHQMPYSDATTIHRDLYGNNYGNQAQPLLISNKGRFIWSEEPINYNISDGLIAVSTDYGSIQTGNQSKNLPEVFRFASDRFFPSQGEHPAEIMFRAPQYNTWIELMYDQNQEDILEYAQNIIDNGFPPGVIMIDDNWQQDYGVWDFSSERFPNPKKMIEQLHEMGFKVMLWVCPFVSPDSKEFRDLSEKGYLLVDEARQDSMVMGRNYVTAALIQWWNGASAVLDLSNPGAADWFKSQLDYLVKEYNVDGFKLDAGDAEFYKGNYISHRPSLANDHTTYFLEVGLDYPLNEYRASWKMAGQPLAQRLRDKTHEWVDLQKLIPDLISQGLMGYAFTCPDMIGGGEYLSFRNSSTIDEELIVRSAQVHALMPMMQFSVAPWRVLSKENQEITRKMAELHTDMGDQIMELVERSAETGEPIVRPLEYNFPGRGYATIKDQFMLGTKILVAPVVQKGQRIRSVILPEGEWTADNGKIYKGPVTIEVDVPLDRLVWFQRN
ncbi:MAG: glycoside hydrolase [Bacteroidetes bacterium]|jgi:alpha-glucosidase|nr:glycoside hydrolase [Bacteroidota bacterium]